MTSDASDTSAAGSPPPEYANSKCSDCKATANGNAARATKRRAAWACVLCRARKVRCNVVEECPCTNCRLDNVDCNVQGSRRRKNYLHTANMAQAGQARAETQRSIRSKGSASQTPMPVPVHIHSAADLTGPTSWSATSNSDVDLGMMNASNGDGNDVPHLLYRRSGHRTIAPDCPSQSTSRSGSVSLQQIRQWQSANNAIPSLVQQAPLTANDNSFSTSSHNRTAHFLGSLEQSDIAAQIPPFIRPPPFQIAAEDVSYLNIKSALTLPSIELQNALLQAYIEYVHPYMPLMDIHEFLNIVTRRDGLNGQTSLFLYQAVMFSASAFVDMKYLREAGYLTRKAARKSFFQRTRLLYDFDYETDRLLLVQALLLMTYWYETTNDQKDTWHWMGVAISLAHTIGLHRNPGSTTISIPKQKLWKRIWWSCFMRDRLIALGMRRPTRIKDEDFDVPMLEESDFEIQPLANNITVVPADCTLMRDVAMQRDLAKMCISKAQLCVCMGHMLKAQYSVLSCDRTKQDNTTNSTMMHFPDEQLDNGKSVNVVDMELMAWAESLPHCCQYRPLTPMDVENGQSTMAVQRTLLHMVYYTTISALHRPQVLPSSPTRTPTTSRQVQKMSRLRVCDAAMHITRMASELTQLRLETYLPTTGVTVILPAMIIHLLEMKNPHSGARDCATRSFGQCMRVMEKLREAYAAADYAIGFLNAALRKADLNVHSSVTPSTVAMMRRVPVEFSAQTPLPENVPYMTASESLFNETSPAHVLEAMAPPNTIDAADLYLSVTSANSNPHTDSGGDMTPSASGENEEANAGPKPMELNLDLMQDHEFDWNAVAGTDFDVDQWLQHPREDVVATAMMQGYGEGMDRFFG